MRTIDGSHGEGGGQILRTSLALAALCAEEVEILDIRAGRKNPGLQAQHLACVEAIAGVCRGSRVEGAALGSGRVRLAPGRVRAGGYTFDVAKVRGSAGSAGLVLQSVLPALAWAGGESRFEIRGGTHVLWAPPIDYLQQVFLPTLARMGLEADLETVRWGWYPKGGGIVRGVVRPVDYLKGVELTERGALRRVVGLSAVSNLPQSIAERQRRRMLARLEAERVPASLELVDATALGQGTFVLLILQCEGTVAAFSALGAKGKPAERVADEAVDAALAFLRSGAAVDSHLADQLVPYMALAEGRSAMTIPRLTQHLLTNIWVAERFLPVKFHTEEGPGVSQVTVEGAGYRRDEAAAGRADLG